MGFMLSANLISPALKIKKIEPKGQGVFAEEKIPKNSRVVAFTGNLLKVSEIEDLTHCLQIGPDLFLSSTGGIDDFINHSCIPSCGIRLTDENEVILFAFDDLEAGSEITFDYATTQTGEHETLSCLCGARNCRKTIGAFRDLPQDLQDFYIEKNAVLPFLLST